MTSTVKDCGAVGDGVCNDTAALQAAAGHPCVDLADGTYLIDGAVHLSVPNRFSGNGASSTIKAGASFPTGAIIELSPQVGSDPKGWKLSNFNIENAGSATGAILLNIATAGKYISKLEVSGIVSKNPTSGIFLELLNPVNIDGLFTSLFCDNWSDGGYYLDNVGDSVILERNTTTGLGRGYYVNQLPTASHIIIRDGNCTSAGGAILVAHGYNVLFENMQVECPFAFTGAYNAAVSACNTDGVLITNFKIKNSNINTQSNPLYCVYLQNTESTEVDGCTLFTNPSNGQHIVIGDNARNTHIGENKYYSAVNGTEIEPKIIDNGIGTSGIWKPLNLVTWQAYVDPVYQHAAGVYKDRAGMVTLRGNLTGAPSYGGQTIFTLPNGFRPKSKAYYFAVYANGTPNNQCLIHVLPSGEVQFINAGATTAYLDGITFSAK